MDWKEEGNVRKENSHSYKVEEHEHRGEEGQQCFCVLGVITGREG